MIVELAQLTIVAGREAEPAPGPQGVHAAEPAAPWGAARQRAGGASARFRRLTSTNRCPLASGTTNNGPSPLSCARSDDSIKAGDIIAAANG
jgi:hypothetical protein